LARKKVGECKRHTLVGLQRVADERDRAESTDQGKKERREKTDIIDLNSLYVKRKTRTGTLAQKQRKMKEKGPNLEKAHARRSKTKTRMTHKSGKDAVGVVRGKPGTVKHTLGKDILAGWSEQSPKLGRGAEKVKGGGGGENQER